VANIRSFPNNQDEYIGAEDVMRWLHGRSSGVFGASGNAAVAPVLDTMYITVSDGVGWISNNNNDGVVWWINNESANGSKLRLPVDMADGVLPRIDRVVVSWQTTNYVALPEVIVLKGTPASNPVAPALTNDNVLRQISLASIRIPAGVTAITAAMITDERLDSSVCGLVTSGISVDTSVMQAQWKASYAEFVTYLAQQQAAWEAFFQNVQNDNVLPVPAANDAGKAIAVNANCDGYTIKDDKTVILATIGTAWVGDDAPYTQAVTTSGVLASDTPHVTPVYSGSNDEKIAQMEAWGMISDGEAGDGVIVFTCFEDKPEVAVSIQIEVNR
jgi:hypothetical protein